MQFSKGLAPGGAGVIFALSLQHDSTQLAWPQPMQARLPTVMR